MSNALGVVIAGGLSTRYGSPKALVEVGGKRVVDRVIAALGTVVPAVVAIANDETIGRAIGVPFRGDVRTGAGALGGIHAALLWARDRGQRGILAVACDTPFLPAQLLRAVLERVGDGVDAVLPESTSRRGVEPLAAWYGVSCLSAIETALDREERRLIGFHESVNVVHLPLEVVRSFGDPDILFMNLNTREDHALAERIAGVDA